tara:strand:+ start:1958 stop:2470 length:513 start_codon:yes stop_codon:yes gene_type:complete
MINLVSKDSKKLTKTEVFQILKLKDSFWKHGLKSQKNWYKKNIKKGDICNLIKKDKKVIGVTFLKKRNYILNGKKKKFLLFDTLIIQAKFRGNDLSKSIMQLNRNKIKSQKKVSLLICEKGLVKFYKKFGWKLLSKNYVNIMDKYSKKNVMIFNSKLKINKTRIIKIFLQ